MKKFNKLIALLLTLVLVLGMLPMVSFASDDSGSDSDDGLVLSKTYDSNTGYLTLEAYATGKTIVTETTTAVPSDIVLVLDVSGSMSNTYTGPVGYIISNDKRTVQNINKSTYYYKDEGNYYKVFSETIKLPPTYTKVTGYSSVSSVINRVTDDSWSLYKNGDVQYYYLDNGIYYPLYYMEQRVSYIIGSGYYYCFAYLKDGSYIPAYGTTAPPSNGGVNSWTQLSDLGDVYYFDTPVQYRLYYNNGNNEKIYFGETVSANNVDAYSGTLYKYVSSGTKLDALKASVEDFIDVVAENSLGVDGIAGTTDDVDHKISIVTFSSNSNRVRNLTSVNESGAMDLKTAVNGLWANGATAADDGLTEAKSVLASDNSRKNSNKVVVLFTDGEPNHGSGFNKTVANDTILISKELKTAGVTVYSIGVFPGDVDKRTPGYMEGVSSDYPNAEAYDKLGNAAADHYFIDASSDSIDLNEVFKTVASESVSGSTSIKLNEQTVLLDIASKYFEIPSNPIIDAYYVDQIGLKKDDKGNFVPVFDEEHKERTGLTIVCKDDSVEVTGFDYSLHYVTASVDDKEIESFDGTNGNKVKGQKLVVKIPVVMNKEAVVEDGYIVNDPSASIPTNGGASGIYDDGKLVPHGEFPVPHVDCEIFTIVHCGDTTDESLHTTEHYIVPDEDDTFNLTKVVNKDVLYGGTFTDAACTEPASEDATKFKPVAGQTYYMWEVSPDHLKPRNLCAYRTNDDGDFFVEDVYLVTAIDRAMYPRFGFAVSKDKALANLSADKIMDESDPDGTIELHSMNDLFNTIEVSQAGNDTKYPRYCDLYPNALTTAPREASESTSGRNASYVACYHLGLIAGDPFYKYTASNPFYFRAFWETKDGVVVFGASTREATYQNPTGTALNVSDEEWQSIVTPVKKVLGTQSVSAAPLRVSNAYSYDSTYESMLTTIPLKALLPEHTEEPEIPVEPADYVEVSDNGKTYKAMILNGAVTLEPAGASGKLFAGWYLDEKFTKAADLTSVKDGDAIYAKYISDAYLNVKYTDSILLKRLSLISAIDARDYAKTGFIVEIGGEKEVINVSSYTNSYLLVSAKTLFGSSIAKNSPLMTCDLSLSGVKKNSSIKITPFAVTKDGTEILGEERTLVYTGFSIKG